MKISLVVALVGLTAALSPVSFAAEKAKSELDIFQYRNVGPVRGGRVTAVAGTVAAESTFYLGSTGGGVWKTTDYGETWSNVSDGYFKTPSIGDISVAQNDPNIVYVGTGSDGLRSNIIVGKGVYKSIDGGKSWAHIGLENVGQIGAVEIDPRDHNTVYVAAIGQPHNANKERGLYKTTDGGKTWEQILYISDESGITDVEMLPGNPNILYASAWKTVRKPWTIISGGENDEGGVFKSVDAGKTWTKVTKGLPTGLIGKIDLAVSPADSRVVAALVEAPGKEGGLYMSKDQGASFKQVSSDKGIRTRPFYYTNVDLDPTNADIVYVMATGYFKSTDGGKSWKRGNPPHGDNHDLWINPNNPDLFIQGNDGGANVTFNGGKTWSTQFNQPTTELYQVEVDDQYPYWLYGGQQDNSTTLAVPSQAPYGVRHRAAWIVDTGGCETGPAVPKPGNHNIVYANCKGRFGVFDKRTGTEKAYYVGAANLYGHDPKDLTHRFQRVAPIHVSPHDPDTVYHGSQYVHRTRDDGVTWETISPDLTARPEEGQVISGSPITRDITGEEYYSTIYSIRESEVEQGVIWVGANDGAVHVTRDGGETWDDVTPRGLPSGGRVDAVEPSPHNPAKAYISVLRYQLGDFKPYIYKTENYGKRWTLLTDGKNGIPSDYPTRVVREDKVREGLLFAGTEFGLFVSLDDGETWKSFQQNLPVTPVTDIKVIRGDIALSTMGRGFWVLDNISTLRQEGVVDQGDQPILFAPKDTIRYRRPRAMFSNVGKLPDYPRPAVIIDYYLAEKADEPVTLEILNANGDIVNTFKGSSKDKKPAPETSSRNMATNETTYISDTKLTGNKGLNRFRWTMSHLGAWHKDAKRRYQNGQMAAPGHYTLRLTVGEQTLEQEFELLIDPRVEEGGTTVSDIYTQTELGLKVTDLVSEIRRYVDGLEKQKKELKKAKKDDELKAVEARLAAVKAADQIYPMPRLLEQAQYLLFQTNGADQKPGKDMIDRYGVLKAEWDNLDKGE